MPEAVCVCNQIEPLDLKTRVALVVHYKELRKTTGTGQLALACLNNSEMHIHGLQDSPLDLRPLHELGRRVLVLYPGPNAVALSDAFGSQDPRPITLVVPDGSWRQASRIPRRIPGLPEAEAVTLPVTGNETRWGIRHEPKPAGLATFEAIAHALGFLESRAVTESLLAIFDKMVKASLDTGGHVLRGPQ